MSDIRLLLALLTMLAWGVVLGFGIGVSKGYDRGSTSIKSIYAPELEKSVLLNKQLHEAAVSYGYAEWIVVNTSNGNTEFRWKAKNIVSVE